MALAVPNQRSQSSSVGTTNLPVGVATPCGHTGRFVQQVTVCTLPIKPASYHSFYLRTFRHFFQVTPPFSTGTNACYVKGIARCNKPIAAQNKARNNSEGRCRYSCIFQKFSP